jgi:hypothetical protein
MMLSESVVRQNVIASHLARMLVAATYVGPEYPHGDLSNDQTHDNGNPEENQLSGLERRKGVGFLLPDRHLGSHHP